ncbi:N-acetylneuraminate synthase family protein [Marinobacter sp. CHS3-4]|uniref:N-acetylneuraminate synthase family protein n=1 Tax=Marinobacter sp. CHS3-4 TaxID=3045174 RepID=UPI0024B4D970|nr:N-acetylneuraminate synthase family protein [Marinobacter sp. CHS3-4]MDI9244975.1 N-acetylneuraminate synthase family protein [Marinobacter sp. CHS3-4]
MVNIIAEAGSNHNGSVQRAIELVDLAKRAGADSVKFQFIFAEGLYLPAYFDGEGYVDNPVFHARKDEELSRADWEKVWSHAHSKGIDISASVFDENGVELLDHLGASYVKIASTDLTNHKLIDLVCQKFQRVILSTGMASLAEIDAAYQFVRQRFPLTDLEFMHCVSSYPCSLKDANIRRIAMLSHAFDCPIGYSDHTEGVVSAAMAVVEGATFFEKHFTVDQTLPGFDHAHALNEDQLADYIETLHQCAKGVSGPVNQSAENEKVTRIRARRGVYASRDLPEGHTITEEDLLFVRPSTAYAPKDLSELVGTRTNSSVSRYQAVEPDRGFAGPGTSNWQSAKDYWRDEMDEKGMQRE